MCEVQSHIIITKMRQRIHLITLFLQEIEQIQSSHDIEVDRYLVQQKNLWLHDTQSAVSFHVHLQILHSIDPRHYNAGLH